MSPEPAGSNAGPTALTCLDLFCGCGGFTLGMQRAGYHVLAALDFNPQDLATFRQDVREGERLVIDLTEASTESRNSKVLQVVEG